jgi:4-diphosphocytidyl-2-C-methyl-D-erythritol kinase
LSTADVYAEADRIPSTRKHLEPERLRALATGSVEELAAALENDLQPAALSLRSNLQDGIDALLGAGALGAGLSGSGPTLFGVFPDPDQAERAAAALNGAIATRLRTS